MTNIITRVQFTWPEDITFNYFFVISNPNDDSNINYL